MPQSSSRRQIAPRRVVDPSARLLDLDLRLLWRSFSRQSFAFWGLCAYLFIEYVRPQSVWRSLDVLPWGQVSLAIPVIGLLFEKRRTRPFLLLDALLIVYVLVVLASFPGAFDISWSFDLLKTFVNWVVLYYLAGRLLTTPPRYLIFLVTFMLWSLKMSQFGARAFVLGGFHFQSWGISGGPGWFQNSGEMAIQMCIFLGISLSVLLGLRRRWPSWKTTTLVAILPGTAFLAVIMSSSRGGQIGAAAVLLVVVAQSRHRVRGLALAAVFLAALWFLVPAQQKSRFASMGDDATSVSRLTYWHNGLEIMREHPVLGVGFNNWIPYYHRYYNLRAELPHNIFIQAGSELGYTGLFALIALMLGSFVTNWRTRRLSGDLGDWGVFFRSTAFGLDAALVGFVVPGYFVTVLYYPFLWMNLSLTTALYLVTWRYRAEYRQAATRVAGRRHGTTVPRSLPLPIGAGH